MNLPAYQFALFAAAVALEVVGTTFLHRSEQFTRLAPSLMTILCYAGAFYFLSHTLKVMPIGIAYAVWSGLGIVLITAIGVLFLGQTLDPPALFGIALILAGVLIVNLYSQTIGH